jgi:hypothetical protein
VLHKGQFETKCLRRMKRPRDPIQTLERKPREALLSKMIRLASEVIKKRRVEIGLLLIAANSLFFISSFEAPIQKDVALYKTVSHDVMIGKMPYRDRVLEYPPYSLGIFLPPAFFGQQNYESLFMTEMFLADVLLKYLLFLLPLRHSSSPKALIPLLCYCVSTPFIHAFYLQRYDIVPALISVAIVGSVCDARFMAAGVFIAVGIGVKVYPIVFLPSILVASIISNRARWFLVGLIVGFVPLMLLSIFLPWWNFAAFHHSRGLQVESLYASCLWLSKLLAATDLHWISAKSMEVSGPIASKLIPYIRITFCIMVLLSISVSVMSVKRVRSRSFPQICKLLLLPLLAFVVFNQVLSPQYLIWILPLACLTSLEGRPWLVLLVLVSIFLTPAFYPTPKYYTGLDIYGTIILIFRNLILLFAWLVLFVELVFSSLLFGESHLAILGLSKLGVRLLRLPRFMREFIIEGPLKERLSSLGGRK